MSGQILRKRSQVEDTNFATHIQQLTGEIAKCCQSLPKEQSLVADATNLVR